jgi:hypothetical protein
MSPNVLESLLMSPNFPESPGMPRTFPQGRGPFPFVPPRIGHPLAVSLTVYGGTQPLLAPLRYIA